MTFGKKVRFIDLFAGIGGFHHAALKVFPDAECVMAVEWDKDCQKVYSTTFPETNLRGDIREVISVTKSGKVREATAAEIRNENLVPEHDILFAGFPCQPFSRRERDHGVREAKLKWAIKNNVRLECEVCGLFMEDLYGARGKDYVEVHHLTPLHVSGETATKPSDLAILCANCHRMIHRAPWTTPAELQKSLTAQLDLKAQPLD